MKFLHLKQWNYLEALKIRLKKDKNGESLLSLEMTKIVLIYCNVVNNSYQLNSRM